MPRNEKAPPLGGRASRDQLGGWSPEAFNVSSLRTQWLVGRFAIAPDTAVMVAAIAFGGGHG
jgi:hypothetical protein